MLEVLSFTLIGIAILTFGVAYGAAVFFAIIMRPSFELSSEMAVAQVTGHMHKFAKVRLRAIGLVGMIATLLLIFVAGPGSTRSWLAVLTAVLVVAYSAVTARAALPINAKMEEAARTGQLPADIRGLQRSWETGNIIRSIIAFFAMVTLVVAAVVR